MRDDWALRDDWPNRSASRFVRAGGVRWHVQQLGAGPPLLLIHGTGSATHSWRDLAPLLAERFSVIAPDLPGHGFSSAGESGLFRLDGMAAALGELLAELDVTPRVALGHSAGAAILIRMALDGLIAPRALVSVNGALLPLSGFPRWLFAPLARWSAGSSWVTHLVARRGANPAAVERLIGDTGSRLDARGLELYRCLFQQPAHVRAALSMMAGWDLQSLAVDLPRLRAPLVLLVAKGDRTIPAAEADRIKSILPRTRVVLFEEGGHLLHEERPRAVAEEVFRLATQARLLAGDRQLNSPGRGLQWVAHPMQS
jgi:magnesium chelatase accessory protein